MDWEFGGNCICEFICPGVFPPWAFACCCNAICCMRCCCYETSASATRSRRSFLPDVVVLNSAVAPVAELVAGLVPGHVEDAEVNLLALPWEPRACLQTELGSYSSHFASSLRAYSRYIVEPSWPVAALGPGVVDATFAAVVAVASGVEFGDCFGLYLDARSASAR